MRNGFRFAWIWAPGALVITLMAGCNFVFPPTPEPIVSMAPTPDIGELAVAAATVDPASCPDSPIEGALSEDPDTGLGILQPNGIQRNIVWPPGYRSGSSIGGSNLFDGAGVIVARSGDNIRISGFVLADGGRLRACGSIEKVPFN